MVIGTGGLAWIVTIALNRPAGRPSEVASGVAVIIAVVNDVLGAVVVIAGASDVLAVAITIADASDAGDVETTTADVRARVLDIRTRRPGYNI
jgi:hypothetical protein